MEAWYVSRLSTSASYWTISGPVSRSGSAARRCRRRASSSAGWKGVTQKSSKVSWRPSRSASCEPRTSSSSGATPTSPRRSVRAIANPCSGSSSAATIAADHVPSRASASSATAVHGSPAMSSTRTTSGGAGTGQIRIGCIPPSPGAQVALELETADVGAVVLPLGALVAQEPLEDVLPERLPDQLRSLHLVEGRGEVRRQQPPFLLRAVRQVVEVAGRLRRELVALGDAPHARGEHHREREVRVAGRVDRPVLDARAQRLLAALGHRHPHQRRAVVAGPRDVDRGLEAHHEALVGVDELVRHRRDL